MQFSEDRIMEFMRTFKIINRKLSDQLDVRSINRMKKSFNLHILLVLKGR